MLQKAIEKLKTEMDGNKNNSYIQVVGQYLLQYLNSNPDAAEKILDQNKSIGKSLNDMRDKAKMKQINGCGMFTPDEGFQIVMKYFGVEGVRENNSTVMSEATIKPEPKSAEVEEMNFDIGLDEII